jgi:hypothetical protein
LNALSMIVPQCSLSMDEIFTLVHISYS